MGLFGWFDERMNAGGALKALRAELDKPVPKHINWAFTLGTTAFALFVLQAASGVLLALNYTPSMKDAYDSTVRITHEIEFGWLIRSVHMWGSDLMVFVLLLHVLRVFLYAGYKRPREMTWIVGAALMLTVLAMGFTGYLLPMEQRSYWATVVVTKSMDDLPLLGDAVARIVKGGDPIGDATLSRFYVMHILALPAVVLGLALAHVQLVRRLGISTRLDVPEELSCGYWKIVEADGVKFGRHVWREMVAVAGALSLVIALAVLAPREAADRATPMETPVGIKPEWYFLPIYQTLKYLPKLAGLLVVNAAILGFVALPFLDRTPSRVLKKRKLVVWAGLLAAGVVVVLGVLGYVSERAFDIFGRVIEFDMYGAPHTR